VVVGIPVRLDGSEGPEARAAREFALALATAGLTVHTWDERLTTRAAERALIAGDMRRQKRRQTRDRVAAALILQGFLDRSNRPRPEER
jgi:putative Holliday junction resolvase